MSFKRGGAMKRRDAVEPAILAALNQVGVQTWQLNGTGCPDVLAFFRGAFYPMEIKSAAGRLTDAQKGIPWPVVRNIEEALAVIGLGLD